MTKQSQQWEVIWESEASHDAEEILLRVLELLLPDVRSAAPLDDSSLERDKENAL
jgi:hypothetical protein